MLKAIKVVPPLFIDEHPCIFETDDNSRKPHSVATFVGVIGDKSRFHSA